ncbi:uncharacterized protein PAC_14280 [Phialocephala subalpina]|uniref:Transmembrane protein n=1 Tax=Phialocephala subalpina TaxID=576137 RepID=A0A1L7XH76_9HELO|nr:uncharacterized protein PAC_14280 [Phialocephala subalpina]
MILETPYMLFARLAMLGLMLVPILAPVVLVTLIAYIEYQWLECNIHWVENLRKFTHPNGSCCCGTCLRDCGETEQIEKRDIGVRENLGKLFKDNDAEREEPHGGARIQFIGFLITMDFSSEFKPVRISGLRMNSDMNPGGIPELEPNAPFRLSEESSASAAPLPLVPRQHIARTSLSEQ